MAPAAASARQGTERRLLPAGPVYALGPPPAAPAAPAAGRERRWAFLEANRTDAPSSGRLMFVTNVGHHLAWRGRGTASASPSQQAETGSTPKRMGQAHHQVAVEAPPPAPSAAGEAQQLFVRAPRPGPPPPARLARLQSAAATDASQHGRILRPVLAEALAASVGREGHGSGRGNTSRVAAWVAHDIDPAQPATAPARRGRGTRANPPLRGSRCPSPVEWAASQQGPGAGQRGLACADPGPHTQPSHRKRAGPDLHQQQASRLGGPPDRVTHTTRASAAPQLQPRLRNQAQGRAATATGPESAADSSNCCRRERSHEWS